MNSIADIQKMLYDSATECLEKGLKAENEAVAFLYLTTMIRENLTLKQALARYGWQRGTTPEPFRQYQDLNTFTAEWHYESYVQLIPLPKPRRISDKQLLLTKGHIIELLCSKFENLVKK